MGPWGGPISKWPDQGERVQATRALLQHDPVLENSRRCGKFLSKEKKGLGTRTFRTTTRAICRGGFEERGQERPIFIILSALFLLLFGLTVWKKSSFHQIACPFYIFGGSGTNPSSTPFPEAMNLFFRTIAAWLEQFIRLHEICLAFLRIHVLESRSA